jgi:hypothetical protein
MYCQRISSGVKAGINFSRDHFTNPDFNTEYKSGFAGGIYLTIMLTEKFGIQPELLYSRQNVADGDILKYTYLNAPIVLRYQVTKAVSIQACPQLGYLMNARFHALFYE